MAERGCVEDQPQHFRRSAAGAARTAVPREFQIRTLTGRLRRIKRKPACAKKDVFRRQVAGTGTPLRDRRESLQKATSATQSAGDESSEDDSRYRPTVWKLVQPWDLTGFTQTSVIHAAMMNAESNFNREPREPRETNSNALKFPTGFNQSARCWPMQSDHAGKTSHKIIPSPHRMGRRWPEAG